MVYRRQWTSEEEDVLITILQEIVAGGGRCEAGSFRSGTYKLVAGKMREKIANLNISVKHVQNKMTLLKDKYSAAYDMLNTSGFGWDDTRQCVTVDAPEILQEYVKKHPNKNYIANKPYERLKTVFGKDRATGSMAESTTDALDHINLESEDAETSLPEPLATPSNIGSVSSDTGVGETTVRKRKRSVVSVVEDITKLIREGITSASADMAKLTSVLASGTSNQMTNLRNKLEAMGLDKMQIIRVGMYFGKNPTQLAFWNTLDDSYKPDFVKAIMEGSA